MTKSSPTVVLSQLLIRDFNNKVVYNESFHLGVNIIRGKNSSGKSTISNFIFYILGGAFNNWTTEAQKCKDVTAEVIINGAPYSLRREIGSSAFTSLQIYWGKLEASKTDAENWKVFPYKQTENLISFSNALFNAMGFPEVKGDLDSNITMHQILRLLYIDQETPPQSLFRYENFDPPLTRKTVSEILLGIYDDSLYTDRISLRDNQKELDLKEREYKNLLNIISHSGFSSNRNTVDKELAATKQKLDETNENIQVLRTALKVNATKRTETGAEKIKVELTKYKNDANRVSSKINQYELEISDSRQFIATLEKRIAALNNSINTRTTIGELTLTYCPQCLGELGKEHEEGQCQLCKRPVEETERSNAKRLLQEMQLQVKESNMLLKSKEDALLGMKNELPNIIERMRFHQRELDLSIENPQSTRDERIDALLVSKGFIESQIEGLTNHLKIVELIEQLKSDISSLEGKIRELKLNIFEKENDQKSKFSQVMSRVKELTLRILRRDLLRQDEFRTGMVVEVDFLKDSFSLDGGNNFSASSKTYFKNAVLFSIFFASVEFDFMRYPRFILCDNMEDKGMEKERTQNFQEIITDISNEYLKRDKIHQVIFTTSMVSDQLNNTEFCVGEYYDTTNKTLKM